MADVRGALRRSLLLMPLLGLALSAAGARAQSDGYVVYLSEYLAGDYYLATLGDLDVDAPGMLAPVRLALPRAFRGKAELGNHDVSADGRRFVFAARFKGVLDWNLYVGDLDIAGARVLNVVALAETSAREEDPRFAWDRGGSPRVVYKCDGDICMHPAPPGGNPAVRSACELWAPSFSPAGLRLSYVKRCDGPQSDRIWTHDLVRGSDAPVHNGEGGADRFAHFVYEETLVYSHIDPNVGSASLWFSQIDLAPPAEPSWVLHDQTRSDDDAYPNRSNTDHIAFIGWDDVGWKRRGGYNLFVYRQSRGDAVRLTAGTPILAPVIFAPR